MTRKQIMLAATLLALAACSKPATPDDAKAIGKEAHNNYVNAINSNDIDKFAAMLTDDVVYQSPNAPEVVGKKAVTEWAKGYFDTYKTRWQKKTLDFKVSGDWAFERYLYQVNDTHKKSGEVYTDIGKGINIFHREADGKWRVAVDGWSSDMPPPK